MKNNTINTPEATTRPAFSKLARRIEAEAKQKKKDAVFYIKNGYFSNWYKENYTNADRGIFDYLTPRKTEQYKNGEITRAEAVKIAIDRRFKEIDKETAKKLERLTTIENSADITSITIFINWKKSAYWGYNPHAEITIHATSPAGYKCDIYTGTASGCGYDKRSAAIAEALNKSDDVLKMLYTAKNKNIKNPSKLPAENDNHSILGYGAGYGVLPYFEGGVGVSSQLEILRRLGFSVINQHFTDTTDYYYLEKTKGNRKR